MPEKPLPVPLSPLLGIPTSPSPREHIARSLSPLIAIAASPDADEICQSNHIPSFADFIKPFGEHVQGRVTPRDSQGTPYAIDNFCVRFKAIDKLDEPNHRALMDVMDDHVRACGSDPAASDIVHIKSRSDVDDNYLDTSLDQLMPWYADFKHMMLSLRGITEHETFDHPVAVLIVISSANPDPMSTIMQLYNPNVPSFTIDKPYVDPNILRFYVLLHDPQQTTLEQSQIVFDKMKKTFGLHCHLLKLNSRPPPSDLFEDSIQHTDENNAIRDIWSQLPTSLNIESRLQARTSTLAGPEILSPNNSSFSTPLSPSPSGHRRSNSASSNTNSFTPPTHGTNLQNGPLDMSSPLEDGTRLPTHDMHLIGSAASPAMQYGRCLTVDDVQNTQFMIKELVVQSLVPFMERNVQHWNEQVASARRGITGRVFGAGRRFFGTSSRTSSPQSIQSIPATGPNTPVGTNTLTIFPYGAPEAQMRKLADYAFMLRDFKFAHAIYDNVRRDYATEKAYKYHAGTQEMIGVCQLMMNQPLSNKLDVDRNFELAVQQYLGRCRSSFHATRTTIMYYELLKARRMWKEVPTALVRMTGEDSDLRSALFLEQAAHCFLRTPSPMARKYGFHLVMAGHRYGKASQRQHAFRCYKLAAHIVEGQEWSVAKSHIQFALGRQAFHLGQLEDAVKYFTNVLADAKQMPQQQAAHIREFLFIYRQYTTQAGIDPLKEALPHLSLPVIDDNSTHVTLSNTQSNTGDNQEEWSTMEIELLEESIAKGYIAGSKKALAIQQQDDQRPICAVGEPFLVHISLFNPLQVAITISQLILGCKHRESLQHNTDTSTESDENVPMIYGAHIEGTNMYAFDDFELEKVSEIFLEPLEKRMISLAIIPRREGSIAVKGLHYTFNDLVHTFKPFHKKGKRLHSTREQLMTPVYAVDHTLDIIVTSPMPLLDLAFHGIPETILSGELVQAVLEINNKGNKGMTALRLKSSHPSFICIGNPEEMDKHVYAGESDSKHQKEEEIKFDNLLFDSSVISVPLPAEGGGKSNERGVVSPGKTTLVPLWIRGDRIGKHTFKFLFSYQSEEGNGAIAHRTLRYTVNLQVLPSLKINAFTRPSTTAVNEYILGIEIENLQVAANFQLNQISATSPVWTITPLSINIDSPQDIQAKTSIPPRQTTFAYYKIQKKAKQTEQSLCPEAWTSTALEALLNNIEYHEPPPPVDLHVSKLSFRDTVIPFNTVPLKMFALNSRVHWRNSNLQSQFPNISPEKYDTMFTLYNSSDVDLTIYWNIPNMKRHGHHYIIGVNLGIVQNPFQGQVTSSKGNSGRTMFEQTAKERATLLSSLTKNKVLKDESPVKLMVKTNDTINHDFEDEGLLGVPVDIVLKNCSWNKTATYTLELMSWTENKVAQSQKSAKPTLNIHPFHWTGATVFTGTLHPDETNTLEAQAIFQLPGVYDVNRWKLTIETSQYRDEHPDSTGYFVQWPSLPQIVTIIN